MREGYDVGPLCEVCGVQEATRGRDGVALCHRCCHRCCHAGRYREQEAD